MIYGESLSSRTILSSVGKNPAFTAYPPLITAASTSGKILGNCAASNSLNLKFLGFFTISNVVARKSVGSFSSINPALWNNNKALPLLVGS